jgi:NTP pyrophosphatase (non-canonical NTP hydrolase)
MKDLALATGKVMPLVYRENLRQLEKWGVQDHDPFQWLAFALEELGELSEAISEYHFCQGDTSDVVKEAVQVATLCLKIAEMFLALKGEGDE